MNYEENIQELQKYITLYKTHVNSLETIKKRIKELEGQII